MFLGFSDELGSARLESIILKVFAGLTENGLNCLQFAFPRKVLVVVEMALTIRSLKKNTMFL